MEGGLERVALGKRARVSGAGLGWREGRRARGMVWVGAGECGAGQACQGELAGMSGVGAVRSGSRQNLREWRWASVSGRVWLGGWEKRTCV